ncbi:MAG TPA: branched-chain amino acid ABC transporter permease [Jatrophihabitans sp.]|jgi:branched-chain amino acid transport system permease protein|nr:branched-chain amino acid ABC transporter permease [Jatrophihabitans sp.]
MSRFIFLTFNGLSFGAVYAAVALALVLIWRTTRVLNFAQGAMATATAYVAISVTQATDSYWLGFVAALAAGLALGAVVRLTAFGTAEHAPALNTIVIGVGMLILIEAVVGMIYGAANRDFPASFSTRTHAIGKTALFSNQNIFTVGSVLALMIALAAVLTWTPSGLRMRAAAFAPEIARLLGVRVGRMLTLGWALSGLVGALAGMLVIPIGLGLYPQAMDGVFVLGFVGAVVGGLDSPVGAVVGGVTTGLALSYASGYLGSDLTQLAALVLLVVVLLVRPSGLFSGTPVRRV